MEVLVVHRVELGSVRACGVVACALGLVGCRPPQAPPTERVVTLLAINDFHAAFPESVRGEEAVGGLSWLASAVDRLRAVHPDALLLDAGDGFQGDPAANATQGRATVDAFSILGVDAAAIGNHEFDHGACLPENCDDPHPLRGALRSAAAAAPFPYLTANTTHEDGSPWAPPGVSARVLLEQDGVKIGVLGLTTQDTPTTTNPVNVADLRFTDVVAAAEREARALRAEGAVVVVALAHVTGVCAVGTPGAPCQPNGELGRLLTELPVGTLDVVIAGHSHRAMTGRVGETLFVETGSHGRALGAIDLVLHDGAVDASRSRVRPLWSLEHVSAEPWCVGEDEVPDGVIDVGGWPLAPHAEAADYTRALGVWFGEGCTVVGCLDTAAWPGRGGSPLGSLVADALLHSVPGADVAVQNSGGLRGALPAGEVRRRDVAGVMPFDNKALLVELSGRDLIAGLQVGTSGAHGVLQPAGLTYTMTDAPVDRDADGDGVLEDWERVGLCGVLVDGAAVDPDETYRVVVPDFLHGGGDHQHLGLGAGTVVSEGPLVRDAIEAWIAADGACREVPQAPRVRLEACDPLR